MKSIIECLINTNSQKSFHPLRLLYYKLAYAPNKPILYKLKRFMKIPVTLFAVFLAPFTYAADLPLAVQIDKQTKIIQNLVQNQDCLLAIKHIDQLQQLTPKLPLPIQFFQGICYFKLGSMEQALQSLKVYFSHGKNADHNYQQALDTYILVEQDLHQQKKTDKQQRLELELQQKEAKQQQQNVQESLRQQRDTITKLPWPMVEIEPGCFYMGSLENEEEKPMHRVCLDNAYAIGQYEVTQQQWQAVMQSNLEDLNSSQTTACTAKNCAITSVSWQTIQLFISKLNQLSHRRYRLPSEAEWEYACRNLGKNQRSCNQNNLDAIYQTFNNKLKNLKPVSQTHPNLIDIYGMNSNVSEWIQDYFSHSYYDSSPLNNPLGPKAGTTRVIRNGCCYSNDDRTSINRFGQGKIYRNDTLGFRLVLDL